MFETKPAVPPRQIKNRSDLGVALNETGVYAVPHPSHEGKYLQVYRLRCIKDGICRDFVDDGVDGGKNPLNGRQGLMQALQKRAGRLPVFFVDERIDTEHPVQVADDEIKQAMAGYIAERTGRREESAALLRAERIVELRKEEAIQKAAEAVVEAGGEATKRGSKARGG